jgi:hypothetical protein
MISSVPTVAARSAALSRTDNVGLPVERCNGRDSRTGCLRWQLPVGGNGGILPCPTPRRQHMRSESTYMACRQGSRTFVLKASTWLCARGKRLRG